MKKIFTLVAAAMMAFTINAQSPISFGIYTYGSGTGTGGTGAGTGAGTGGTGTGTGAATGGTGTGTGATGGTGTGTGATGGTGTGTGTGGSTELSPIIGMSGYSEQGTVSYQVTNDGNETYTIKNFLGGSDYSFTITDTGKGASTDGPNNPITGNTVTVTEVGTYTAPTDYTIFSKDGHEALRFKDLTFGYHSNSKLSLDGEYILFRRNVSWNNTFETSTNGTSWTAMPNNNSIVIAAIIPVIKKNGGSSAIDEINANDENAPVEYYNLQGMRINEPAAGQIVIRRQGSKVSKIVF